MRSELANMRDDMRSMRDEIRALSTKVLRMDGSVQSMVQELGAVERKLAAKVEEYFDASRQRSPAEIPPGCKARYEPSPHRVAD